MRAFIADIVREKQRRAWMLIKGSKLLAQVKVGEEECVTPDDDEVVCFAAGEPAGAKLHSSQRPRSRLYQPGNSAVRCGPWLCHACVLACVLAGG